MGAARDSWAVVHPHDQGFLGAQVCVNTIKYVRPSSVFFFLRVVFGRVPFLSVFLLRRDRRSVVIIYCSTRYGIVYSAVNNFWLPLQICFLSRKRDDKRFY